MPTKLPFARQWINGCTAAWVDGFCSPGVAMRQDAGVVICKTGATGCKLPLLITTLVTNLSHQLVALHRRLLWYGHQLDRAAARDERVTRLRTIPGVGPITASAIAATIGDGRQFPSGRSLAAWLGLAPLNRSSGKERLGRISKMGDRSIRRLLVPGMTSRIKQIRQGPDKFDPSFAGRLDCRRRYFGFRVSSCRWYGVHSAYQFL